MKNLQAVIDFHMEEAQTIWANEKDMQIMKFEDAAATFAIKKDIENGLIDRAVELFNKLDTSPAEDIAVALVKDMGHKWTEQNFGIEVRI
tara:strand:- start:2536 stop:2805 length:270 start_codon:yes stop_codon:yes gene_type:complete